MAKPAIISVDDDPEVLRAVERDLRRKYAEHYRVLRADSGRTALEIMNELQVRNNPVALFLVDQRMPGMSGVEFLEKAIKIYPDAKRVLLTAYADTDAAIAAINGAQIHHYLLKPWDPPEENLYPVLDDLLDDWRADFIPPFDGIRVLGNRWSPASHNIKDFLARNHIPYRWLDIETADNDPEVKNLIDTLGVENQHQCLPFVVFPDGTQLVQPEISDVAQKVGLKTHAAKEFYDLAIVGGGPAGLAAAVYGASEGLRTIMIEREAPGGQAGMSSKIENYLGFPAGLSGGDLTRRAVTQARRFGVEILAAEAEKLRVDGSYRFVELTNGSEISCHSMLIATGVQWRKLDAPGIERLTGAGIYYGAAMTEAIACRDEDVFVVGGANSAGQAAMHFFAIRAKSCHVGPGRVARRVDVAISHQPDRKYAEHPRRVQFVGGRGSRRRASRFGFGSLQNERRNPNISGKRTLYSDRRQAPDRLARRHCRTRRSRFYFVRLRFAQRRKTSARLEYRPRSWAA